MLEVEKLEEIERANKELNMVSTEIRELIELHSGKNSLVFNETSISIKSIKRKKILKKCLKLLIIIILDLREKFKALDEKKKALKEYIDTLQKQKNEKELELFNDITKYGFYLKKINYFF